MPVYDVIVIGSGPAGLSTGRVTTLKGLDTLILDQKLPPRNPFHTVVLLGSTQVLMRKLFPLTLEECLRTGRVLVGLQLHFAAEPPLSLTFTPPARLVYRRELVNQLLLEAQLDCHEGVTVTNLTREGKTLLVECLIDGQPEVYRTKYVVVGDGSSASLLRKLDPRYYRQTMAANNFLITREIFRGTCPIAEKVWHVFMPPKFRAFNFVHRIGDYLFVDLLTNNLKTVLSIQSELLAYLKKHHHFKIDSSIGRSSWVANNSGYHNQIYYGKRKVLFIGSAAGFSEQLQFGIAPAIESGNAAGQALSERSESLLGPLGLYKELTADLVRRSARQKSARAFYFGSSNLQEDLDFTKAMIGLKLTERLKLLHQIRQRINLINYRSTIKDPDTARILSDDKTMR